MTVLIKATILKEVAESLLLLDQGRARHSIKHHFRCNQLLVSFIVYLGMLHLSLELLLSVFIVIVHLMQLIHQILTLPFQLLG